MSRNLGAKNFSGTTLFVSFVENRVKVTIFLVVLCLLLSIVGADKEPQEPSDLSRDPVTEIPDLVVSLVFFLILLIFKPLLLRLLEKGPWNR